MEFSGQETSHFGESKNPYEIKSYGNEDEDSTGFSRSRSNKEEKQDFRTKLIKHDHPKSQMTKMKTAKPQYSQEQNDLNKEFEDFMTNDNSEEIKVDVNILQTESQPKPAEEKKVEEFDWDFKENSNS